MKRLLSLVMVVCLVFTSASAVFAEGTDDQATLWDIFGSGYYEEPDYTTPVIVWPDESVTILASDEVEIEWMYEGTDPCTVFVKDSAGNVSQLKGSSENNAKIMANKLARGGTYTITVKAGEKVSEPFTLKVADLKREMVEIIDRTYVEPAEPKISEDVVLPGNAFATREGANKKVKAVTVKVWKLRNGKKVPSTMSLTVNAALADTVVKIFDEIYNNSLQFPISSLGCYSYRTTAGGERLSEHAYGTAIDVNYNENYCVYSNGTVVGSFYKPYESPYSVTPEIINIFRKYNFYWGGSFGDYMHFSYFGT